MSISSCSTKAIALAVVSAALVVVVVLLIVLLPPETDHGPQVTVREGVLEGEWLTAATGDRYASFRGIPYALPPTGKLRFKAPVKPATWNGILKATSDGNSCLQGRGRSYSGHEDCLFLNVYTPRLPRNDSELLPVYFLVHGGKFQIGSGGKGSAGPDFFIHEGIVVVAFNYRLGLFGYLSLDDEEIPGNAAVKDQLAALRWVNENIAKFGGDPKKVTVGGESAGSASAHWLSILPQTKGLIRSVILMSGTAFHNWAYKEDFLDVAQRLGRLLKNDTEQALSTQDLHEVFMSAPAKELNRVGVDMSTAFDHERKPDVPFCPTPERRTKGSEPLVVTRDAESYFWKRDVKVLPTLVGITNREWMVYALQLYGWLEDKDDMKDSVDNLIRLIPKNIIPYEDTRAFLNLKKPDTDMETTTYNEIIKEVRKNYFEVDNKTCDFECKVLEYCDHIFMAVDTNRFAQFRAENESDSTPVYLYRLAVTTQYTDHWKGLQAPPNAETSAVHGDISRYIYHYDNIDQEYYGNDIASLTLRRVTKMFSNFIKGGEPVPQTDNELSVKWTPNKSAAPRVSLLNIGEELSMREAEELPGRFVKFWNDMYNKYRR